MKKPLFRQSIIAHRTFTGGNKLQNAKLKAWQCTHLTSSWNHH